MSAISPSLSQPQSNSGGVLSKIFLGVASCVAIHIALVTFGGEPVIHAAGEALRQSLFGGAGACEVINGALVCPS